MAELEQLVERRAIPTTRDDVASEFELGTIRRFPYRFALLAAVALGLLVRAYHVLSQDFPLNDGGLFFAMVRDLQAASYQLPAFTTYNSAGIPYGYSPLGFYLAALLDDFTPLALPDVFRLLPLVVSCLSVGAFALLARDLLPSRASVVAAVVAFGLVPRSFLWMLMGGGVTRAPGLLFALLALHQLHRLYKRRDWRAVAPAALFGGLTVLSHLGTAPFLVFSSLLFFLALGRHREGLLGSAAVAAGATVISAPWWGQVLAYHGPGPFLAAGATGGSIFQGLTFRGALETLAHFGLGTGESVLGLIGLLAVVGFFFALARGQWLLPAWWITIVVFDARQGSTFATVPIALLAGRGAMEVLLPAMRGARFGLVPGRRARANGNGSSYSHTAVVHAAVVHAAVVPRTRFRLRHWAPEIVLGVFLLFSTITALLRLPELVGGLPDLRSLTPGERGAMQWVARSTPVTSRLLVVANSPWEIDKHSEWLPVLGRRVSVATVQGYEWRPRGQFITKKREYVRLQGCSGWVSDCLNDWSRETGVRFSHVYLPKHPTRECCRMLRASLDRDTRYRRVYDGPGASIYELQPR
jgi:hypothetical protein